MSPRVRIIILRAPQVTLRLSGGWYNKREKSYGQGLIHLKWSTTVGFWSNRKIGCKILSSEWVRRGGTQEEKGISRGFVLIIIWGSFCRMLLGWMGTTKRRRKNALNRLRLSPNVFVLTTNTHSFKPTTVIKRGDRAHSVTALIAQDGSYEVLFLCFGPSRDSI